MTQYQRCGIQIQWGRVLKFGLNFEIQLLSYIESDKYFHLLRSISKIKIFGYLSQKMNWINHNRLLIQMLYRTYTIILVPYFGAQQNFL